MNENDRSGELLRDLAKLLLKYPADTWRTIFARLHDRQLISQLEAAVDAVRTRSSGPSLLSSGASRRPADPLRELGRTNAPLAQVLADFRAKLRRGELMPNLAELREFAHVCGIKEQVPLKREQAISFVVRHLAERQPKDVAQFLGSIRATRRDFEAEFERWANLIMQRSKPE